MLCLDLQSLPTHVNELRGILKFSHYIFRIKNGGLFILRNSTRCGFVVVNCLFVLAMAALDSTSELSNLLDTWRKEDQDNVSPVKTLKRLVKCKSGSIFGKISAQPPYYNKTKLFPQWQCVVFVIVFSIEELNA